MASKTQKDLLVQQARLGRHLPSDPIDMSDAEIGIAARAMADNRGLRCCNGDQKHHEKRIRGAIGRMRSIRENKDADNKWYWATYLPTPQKRRNHLMLMLTSYNVG